MSTPARRRLAAPTAAMLPRVADSLSFLYLDVARVVQDSTGVCALVESHRGEDRVYIPTAALSCVLLGPGTSITQPALTTFTRHGTTVVCVGSGGVRCYAGIVSDTLTTEWLERQVHAWSDDARRLDVATRMYTMRFGTPPPPGTNLAALRGLEGQRVKALYHMLATKYRLPKFKRSYDPADWDNQNPVNQALSSANTCLYGIVHAATLALGCSPALGFVHTGTQYAFVYDIADLYKARLTIPLAFSLHASPQPERDARLKLRDDLRLFRLLPTIVTDIQALLAPDADPVPDQQPDDSMVNLWDPEAGPLPAGVNYGADW
jgi:CRISP-associated protein Cas1